VLVLFLSLLSLSWLVPSVLSDTERSPSKFKVGDEWMALPEVFSNLDFDADNTPASDDDVEGQLRLRSTRFWGRIYIDGWPQTIQFFRAHFGIEPPIGRVRFVFAEPRDACSELTNANLLTENHVLLVNRGTCTFGTKAKNAQLTKAKAVVIVNNEPGLEHLPGPDAHDIQFSVSSIAQPEGLLLETIYDEGPPEDGFGRKLEGYMVPINCEVKCLPATVQEKVAIQGLNEGGSLKLSQPLKDSEYPLEYLLAHFGTKVLNSNIAAPLVMAKPDIHACRPLENDVKGKVVLVRRGGCSFVKKSENIQASGGRTMIVGSMHPYIVRMGVEPRWKGLNTAIPVVMVSNRVYSILVAESVSGGQLSFVEDYSVNGTVWESLEKLYNGEGWPRSDSYIQKKLDELNELHQSWPDRLIVIKEAYNKRVNTTSSSSSATASLKSEL